MTGGTPSLLRSGSGNSDPRRLYNSLIHILPVRKGSRRRVPVFTPTGYVSPVASLRKKTKMDVVRERTRDNIRDLEKVTGGIIRMSRSNNVFTDIFNVE